MLIYQIDPRLKFMFWGWHSIIEQEIFSRLLLITIQQNWSLDQGWQIFPCKAYQNSKICTKLPQNIPNAHNIYIRYGRTILEIFHQIYVPTFSITRTSKIYPNYYFWSENIPSGNPGLDWLLAFSSCLVLAIRKVTCSNPRVSGHLNQPHPDTSKCWGQFLPTLVCP
jgi:hypothetical protein